MSSITTGTNGTGLRWARQGEWRVTAYAEGGYAVSRYVEGPGWILADENMPADVERALCAALGIRCERDPEPRRYDVNATVCDLDTWEGVDGAYSLICRNATADEIAAKLRELLSSEWGYSEDDGPTKPAGLSIQIGPAGSGDDLPL